MIKFIKRGLLSAGILGTGALGYNIYDQKNPKEQLPFDSSKETLAVLGSGWGAVSFLKNIDSNQYNIVVISPRNYFLFSPLLPSATVGTVELRSIMQPIRYITRHHSRKVTFIEGECTDIDIDKKILHVNDNTNLGVQTVVKYDKLVIACGAENATFGIPGVKENACFLKESWDAKKIRAQLMDCIENAAFPGQSEEEIQKLLHMVVVGGGPTGVEYAAELYDFLHEDLSKWYPDIAGKIKITLVEAMPSVLPMFSKELIEYTQKQFSKPDLRMRLSTTVKRVNPKDIVVLNKNKEEETIPYGLLVWATGNTPRPLIKSFIQKLPTDVQTQKRGLVVDEYLKVKGTGDIWALGDCTATQWAPTAQVASSQGQYLSSVFNSNDFSKGFEYNHLGSLAYIGSDKAIADLPFGVHVGGALTYYFWRSAYLSNLFSVRNKSLVMFDWTKKSFFGRDISRE